ncbi:hypothetical protein DM02DRAFT_617273 [Periconia macrospinosa]|uniref:Uncharacterized protein n=1 Tax=Periconia macrospinosa TaxID=97972 RepID=A0A2V1DEB9_9PLEO|nr:hypothetical protein DM02DRAFT_617273 [Periconia macrospinosa]
MSASIAIPKRKQKVCASTADSGSESSGIANNWKYGSYESVKGDDVASTPTSTAVRRPSLMSKSITKTEHTVINVGNSETPRLITCVKASQGFDWNQEIFLPSYASFDFDNLERKQDPVEEIVLTDEEIANMFPS